MDPSTPTSASILYPGDLFLGSTKKLSVNIEPRTAEDAPLSWKIKGKELNGVQQYVNENEIASIDQESGLLTPKAQGKVSVSIWLGDTKYDEITLLIQSTAWDGISSKQPRVEGNTYHITTGAELRWIAEQCNNGNNFFGETIVLDNSIDLGGKNETPAQWEAIGNGGYNSFNGTLDGQGFTINNLYSKVTSDNAREFSSFIGWMSTGGTVKNLCVNNAEISNNSYVTEKNGIIGAIMNATVENVVVENCKISGIGFTGGLAGTFIGDPGIDNIVKNCSVINTIVTGNTAGGLIGVQSKNSMIINCFVEGGMVQANEENKPVNIGGLIGYTEGNTSDYLKIYNSYTNLPVKNDKQNTEADSYVGGLIGKINSPLVMKNVYAAGNVINKASEGSNYVPGGIAGYINVYDYFSNFDQLSHLYFNGSAIHENKDGAITAGKLAFGTNGSLVAGNSTANLKVTEQSQEIMQSMDESGLVNLLNENVKAMQNETSVSLMNWKVNSGEFPKLTDETPITVTIKQKELYLRRNEYVEQETVMKPYNATKELTVSWTLNEEADANSFELIGNRITIKPTAVTYAVATVKMTAVDETGKAYTDTVTVTVMPEESGITKLTIKDPGTISTGDTVQMEAEIEPANALKEDVIWSIKKGYEKYGEITSSGKLKAKKAGVIIVQASIGGKTAECTITIQAGSKWDGETVEEPESSGNFYYITNASELAWIAQEVNAGHYDGFSGKTIMLMNDIDLNHKGWTPIGITGYSFQGTFNGNDKTIRNFELISAENDENENIGLFYILKNANIKNLQLDNILVNSASAIGGLMAVAAIDSQFSNIMISGVTVNDWQSFSLFLIESENINIENVKVSNSKFADKTKDSKNHDTFGLVGGTTGKVRISDVRYENNVMEGKAYPLIGFVEENSEGISDIEVYNTNVSGVYNIYSPTEQWRYFGGLICVSHAKKIVVQNCSFNGTVKQVKLGLETTFFQNMFGGLIGFIDLSETKLGSIIENNYVTGSVKMRLKKG